MKLDPLFYVIHCSWILCLRAIIKCTVVTVLAEWIRWQPQPLSIKVNYLPMYMNAVILFKQIGVTVQDFTFWVILSFSFIMDSFWKTESLHFKGRYFHVWSFANGRGVKLYKCLPLRIKKMDGLKQFRREVKSILLNETFYTLEEFLQAKLM